MEWEVLFCDEFVEEFGALPEALQDELLAHACLLREYGPQLGRPTVDTLKGSKYSNMKELRFDWADGVWRIAFAFDPERRAVLLVGGDKGGTHQKRFYGRLIRLAEDRYMKHVARLAATKAGAATEKRRGKKS